MVLLLCAWAPAKDDQVQTARLEWEPSFLGTITGGARSRRGTPAPASTACPCAANGFASSWTDPVGRKSRLLKQLAEYHGGTYVRRCDGRVLTVDALPERFLKVRGP